MRYCLIALLILVCPGPPATAQTEEATLRIVVTDQNGAAIRDAKVTAESPGSKPRTANTKGSGEAQLSHLTPGKPRVTITAPGFEALFVDDLELKPGLTRREVRLQVANVRDEVQVAQDKRESNTDLRGDAFSSVLTSEQLALLPDDPDELEEVIRNMAGPGARIRVNGFTGGKLPPKNQIREIRFRTNQFAAENHDPGFAMVDIFTKPGVNLWHGGVNFGFRDANLNGRNAAAPVRGPGQDRRYAFDLSGPLWKNHTSLFISGDGLNAYDTKTIVAALPTGRLSDLVERPVNRTNFTGRVEHGYGKTHALRFEYQRTSSLQENLGVGNFDLADRAYSSDSVEHLVRFSETGTLGKKLFNEIRFQQSWRNIGLSSFSNATTIQVLDSFTSGGAQNDSLRITRESELTDNLDLSLIKKHLLRSGFTLETGGYNSTELTNINGTFTFANLADYVAARPLLYTKRTGIPAVNFSQYQVGLYVQDDWRVRKDLSLNFGVRYEGQTNLKDKNNFAPRAGFAWSPFRNGKTTFRGGVGLFYEWFGNTTYEQILRVNGAQSDLLIRNPGYPDPYSGGSVAVLPPSVIQAAGNLIMPYLIRSTIGVDRELPHNVRLMFNYSHTRGVHELRAINANQAVPGIGRPFPNQGNITQVNSIANSKSDTLMANLNWTNFQKGLFLAANYRYGRNFNEADGPFSLPVDSLSLKGEYGPAASDIRHMFFAMAGFPIYKLIRSGVTFNYLSAQPYNITTGFDNNGDALINDRPSGIGRNSGRGGNQINLGAKVSWSFGWGKLKENGGGGMQVKIVRGEAGGDMLGSIPGGGMSLATKRFKSELYLQASNILNHANLFNFVGVQSSPFFGQATAALPARRLETGIRFNF